MSLTIVFLLLAVALAVGVALGRAAAPSRGAPSAGTHGDRGDDGRARERHADSLRAQALDASLEAILIVSPDGHVRDCNASALAFFDRHRAEVVALEAVALRRLIGADGGDLPWATIIASRAPWMGDGLARLPDGSLRECLSRVIPLFGASGEVTALVEVHRDPRDDGAPTTRAAGFPHAALLGDAHDADGSLERQELRFLAAAFRDLDRVLRQYERLLPAMRAEDPLSEVIAGVAAETSEVTRSVDVPTLLREIPRVLGRLDAQVRRREAAEPAPPPTGPGSTSESR